MKTLPNGITIFNATPHRIRFWQLGWAEPIEVPVDKVISAHPHEEVVRVDKKGITYVRPTWIGDDHGRLIAERALLDGADVVVGSVIAAQCYQNIVAMCPCKGYERVPPDQKRMRPDKFTAF